MNLNAETYFLAETQTLIKILKDFSDNALHCIEKAGRELWGLNSAGEVIVT